MTPDTEYRGDIEIISDGSQYSKIAKKQTPKQTVIILKYSDEVPLWYSGLRIQHCHCSGLSCCGVGLILGLGIFYMPQAQPKKQNKKKKGNV